MKSSHIYLPLLLILLLSAAAWGFTHQGSTQSSTPLPQSKTQTVLTPANAAQIAQNRFPGSQIQTILLESTSSTYNYLVSVDTLDQGLYQLSIALADGHINSVQTLDTPQTLILPIAAIAQQLSDNYPAARIMAITLQNDEQLIYYQAILEQDHTQITLSLQAADGQILKEQRASAATDWPAPATDFGQVLTLAIRALPQKQLTALSLTASGHYNALYQDEGYQYTLLLDAYGNELERTTVQRGPSADTLTAQGSIAFAE